MEIKQVNIKELKPAEYNPRKWSEKAISDLKQSISTFGIVDPIIVNSSPKRKNIVIGGHFRLHVAKLLDYKDVPVVYVDIQDEKKERELNLRLNKNSGDWDFELLKSFDEEILKDVGFESDDLDKILKIESGDNDDDVSEVPKKPKSKLGDIYILNNHRLMCGDSTKREDIEKLMDGKKADMVFTDPPYGVSIGDKNKSLNSVQKAGRCIENIENDTLTPDELYKVLVKAFTNVRAMLHDHASVYVTAPQGGGLGMMMMMMMKDAGLEVRHILNWVKNIPTFSLGRLDYDYQHEPILFTWIKTHKKIQGGQHKTSCWFIDKPRESKLHPTMKPVAVVENAILNSSERGDILIDIFCGSGTSVLACEKTNRICYGMELDPKYVDVIVKRWEDFTGKKAIKNAKTFPC